MAGPCSRRRWDGLCVSQSRRASSSIRAWSGLKSGRLQNSPPQLLRMVRRRLQEGRQPFPNAAEFHKTPDDLGIPKTLQTVMDLQVKFLVATRQNCESQVSGIVRNRSKIGSAAGSPRSADSMDQPFFGVSLMADSHRTREQEKSELDRNTSFQECGSWRAAKWAPSSVPWISPPRR
ncbi:MAG: hypothetical protein H6Q05_2630 [Acidobacteria bacterium]|nr:hypothetical protein [Acidobacteriota bacterium]